MGFNLIHKRLLGLEEFRRIKSQFRAKDKGQTETKEGELNRAEVADMVKNQDSRYKHGSRSKKRKHLAHTLEPSERFWNHFRHHLYQVSYMMTFGQLPIGLLKNTTLDTKVSEKLAEYRSKDVLTRRDFLKMYGGWDLKRESEVYKTKPDYILFTTDHATSPPTCGYSNRRLWRIAAKAAGLPARHPTCGDKLKSSYERLPKVMQKVERVRKKQEEQERLYDERIRRMQAGRKHGNGPRLDSNAAALRHVQAMQSMQAVQHMQGLQNYGNGPEI